MFGVISQRETQLKIYSMFMLADGECSAEEQRKLNTLCKEMNIGDDTKKEMIAYCNGLPIKHGDNSDLIIQEINKLLVGSSMLSVGSSMFSWFMGGLNHSTNAQVETIWTLINLGYADTEFSNPEKKVVDYLVKKWELKKIIMDELLDTADTILMLTKQKEWLKTTTKSYDEIEKSIHEIDQKIQLMFDNIKASISEADAV